MLLIAVCISMYPMEHEDHKHTHTLSTVSEKNLHGIFNDNHTTQTVDLSYIERNTQAENSKSSAKYSRKFIIVTNAGTALITAGISAGVAIAIAYNKCGK